VAEGIKPPPPAEPAPRERRSWLMGCPIWSVRLDCADDGGDAKKDIVFELSK